MTLRRTVDVIDRLVENTLLGLIAVCLCAAGVGATALLLRALAWLVAQV